MNLFKKALVASAIVTACGSVNAADLTAPAQKYSTEGLGAITPGTTVTLPAASTNEFISTRVIVREQLEAGDTIKLAFSKGISLTSVKTGADISKAVTVGDGISAVTELGIDYGSGDFTVSGTIAMPTAAGITVATLTVDVGETIDANASFEVFFDPGQILLANAGTASVSYSAISGLDGTSPKDTTGNNMATLVRQESQYEATVTSTKLLNGLIERETMKTFTENGKTNDSTDTSDTFEVKITDNQSLRSALPGTASNAIVTLKGNVNDNATSPIASDNYVLTATPASGALTPVVIAYATGASIGTSASATLTGIAGTGLASTITLELDAANKVIEASEYTVDVAVDTDKSATTDALVPLVTGADAGSFEIDATVVNLPYVPVNFDGLNSIVHMTNKSASPVDVMVSAYSLEADGSSETYAQTSLVTIPAYSMKKVDGKNDIAAALSITEPTKLNVTFNIDATKDTVDVYAFSNTSNGRTEISNSTQKGIK